MRPPCAVTIPCGDREPEPGAGGRRPAVVAGRARGAVELPEHQLLRARRHPGAAVRHFHADRTVGRPRGHRDRGPWRRVLGGVLQQVDEHLLDQQLVHRHQREVGRQVHLDGVAGELLLQPKQRHADHLLQRLPRLLHGERAGLDPDHVQQVGDEPGHAAGLLENVGRQLPAALGRQRAVLLQQAARGALDGGERRPEVVRQRAQQGAAQALRLGLDPGLLPLLGEHRPLKGQRRLLRQRLDRRDLGRRGRPVGRLRPDHHHAHLTGGGSERHDEHLGIGAARGAEPRGAPVPMGPARHHPLRRTGEQLARGRRPGRGIAVELLRREGAGLAAHRTGDVPRQRRQHVIRALRLHQLRIERGHRPGPPRPLLRLGGVLEDLARQAAHRERHDQHDREGQQVGAVVNVEGVVRRHEQEVERRDAQQRGQEAGPRR